MGFVIRPAVRPREDAVGNSNWLGVRNKQGTAIEKGVFEPA